MHWEALDFELPGAPEGMTWRVLANTALPSPEDICEDGREAPLSDQVKICVGGRSVVILVAR